MTPEKNTHLKRSLSPWMVWGLGVGYVISGNYFGWNLGLEKGGTLGMGIALLFIITLYITFTFSYTELACSIPKAGGAFDYAARAFGKDVGFVVGMAQNIEFIFAPPAIAFAIGAYLHIFFPQISVTAISIGAYLLFFWLNAAGVQLAAKFELIVTTLAVLVVIFFSAMALPHFSISHFSSNAFPFGMEGAFAATPFAIWFFLGIEGVANLAEEAVNPKRTILLGFGSAIATLVVLCIITFVTSIGIGGWEKIVFKPDGTASDSPLPLAMQMIVGENTWQYHVIIAVGLLGLIASFHGLMLAASRAVYEFGKARYAPSFLGNINARFQTPINALLVNMGLGILALLTGRTAEIITISVFGALTLYIFSMLSLFRLRRTEPNLERPFRVPMYPIFPIIALCIAVFSLAAMVMYNFSLFGVYVLILSASFIFYKVSQVIIVNDQ